jgi:D-alanyl-D-alanine carboxypeptidase
MLTGSRVPSNDMGRRHALVLLGAVAALAAVPAPGGALPSGRGGGFWATVSRPTRAELSHSYRSGCPVAPGGLRVIDLPYWGFDGKRHAGSIVVNATVVPAVERVFATLLAERFPIRRMEPVDAFGGSDDRSMAADNTSAFNCRYAVTTGPKVWSAHAYGEAIDVDPLENPYLIGSKVLPPAGRSYLDRADVRPGMAVKGGGLVDAFAAVGWQWGGRWTSSPDYQHFSSTGG